MILGMVAEAVDNGVSEKVACETVGVSKRTLQRWRKQDIGDDNRAGPTTAPGNKLSEEERQEVLRILNSEKYRDLSPWQVVPKLADQGVFLASESTMYRLLHAADLQKHRGPAREPHKRYRPRELVATAPNQVWSWDITYLATPVRGAFFYAYMVIDVFSRKVVGHVVHDRECGELAKELLEEACRREWVDQDQLVIHSDNGGPMKSATLLATLHALGVATSFSRPSVSNDNSFSEAAFRTVKYRPQYPKGPFLSLEAAREWFEWFVAWYNTEHQHSAIRFVTPDERHRGADTAILNNRERVYAAAKARNSERWTGKTRNWSRVEVVRLNPAPEGTVVA